MISLESRPLLSISVSNSAAVWISVDYDKNTRWRAPIALEIEMPKRYDDGFEEDLHCMSVVEYEYVCMMMSNINAVCSSGNVTIQSNPPAPASVLWVLHSTVACIAIIVFDFHS